MKKFFSILIALVMLLSVSAVAEEAPTLKLGSIQALSGSSSTMGNMIQAGIDWYIELANREGGVEINGVKHKIEMIKKDSESSVDKSILAYQDLASSGCVAVVGPHQANIGIALASVAEETKVPVFCMGMDNRVTRQGEIGNLGEPWEYMFLSQPSCDLQGAIMAKWGLEQGFNKYGVLYRTDNSYSYSLYYAFDAYVKANGGEIVCAENFIAGDTDFSTQIMKLIDSGADCLFTPNYTGELGGMIEQLRSYGWEGTIIAGLDAAPVLDEQVDAAYLKDVIFVSNVDLTSELINGQWNGYAEWSGYEGATNLMKFCLGYDMAGVLVDCASKVGADSAAITAAMSALKDYEGLTGMISLGEDTHQPYGLAMSIYRYNGNGGGVAGYDLLNTYSANPVDYSLE